jgi:hypothetical protein
MTSRIRRSTRSERRSDDRRVILSADLAQGSQGRSPCSFRSPGRTTPAS